MSDKGPVPFLRQWLNKILLSIFSFTCEPNVNHLIAIVKECAGWKEHEMSQRQSVFTSALRNGQQASPLFLFCKRQASCSDETGSQQKTSRQLHCSKQAEELSCGQNQPPPRQQRNWRGTGPNPLYASLYYISIGKAPQGRDRTKIQECFEQCAKWRMHTGSLLPCLEKAWKQKLFSRNCNLNLCFWLLCLWEVCASIM